MQVDVYAGVAMADEKPTNSGRPVSALKVVWSVSIVLAATAIGAHYGWDNHGFVGALALGFVGFVGGCFLSSPSLLFQLLT